MRLEPILIVSNWPPSIRDEKEDRENWKPELEQACFDLDDISFMVRVDLSEIISLESLTAITLKNGIFFRGLGSIEHFMDLASGNT